MAPAREARRLKPYLHRCERCGQEASLQRVSRFSEDDYRELLQDYFALESSTGTQLHFLQTKLDRAREDIAALQAIVRELLEPPILLEPEPEYADNPFA